MDLAASQMDSTMNSRVYVLRNSSDFPNQSPGHMAFSGVDIRLLVKSVCIKHHWRLKQVVRGCCYFPDGILQPQVLSGVIPFRLFKSLDGQPRWLGGLAPAFGPGQDPGDPGLSPVSGSLHGACFSFCLCLCLSLSHE